MSNASNLESLSDAIAGIVSSNGDSLVRVEGRCGRSATGVAWSNVGADTLIVAEHQALERSELVELRLGDGSTAQARVVGRDGGTNVALLKLEGRTLTAPRFAMLDGAKVGHLIVSLARPGKSVRATLGVISALSEEGFRTWSGGKIERYLEASFALPVGFGGGPVLDGRGEALGIATSGLMRGATLVVPTVTLRRVVDELLSHGRIRRGYLGVGVQPVRLHGDAEKTAQQSIAALVAAIEPNSPAEKGGILLGDLMLSIDGTQVARPGDLAALLQDRIGVEIVVKVLRAGKSVELRLTTGQRA
jgi:S1-C subfamily serine protease